MTIGDFIGDNAASPIGHDDVSTSGQNITQLSLPESFDESLCLDSYKCFNENTQCLPKRQIIAELRKAPNRNVSKNDYPIDDMSQQNDLELKVRELLSANLELKEKGRLYDSLRRRSTEHEGIIEELRSQMQHHKAMHESSIVRENELQHEMLEYKRKVHLLNIDLEHARKESEVFLGRAEKAEKDWEVSASSLRKLEDKISRMTVEKDEAKSRNDREMARIRQECSDEITSLRTHQNEAFARESKLLCDARDQALEQTRLLQRELNDLRTDRDSKDADNTEIIKELERQLADIRSDYKVKSCELNTLQSCQARTAEEATKWKEELEQLQQQHSSLERQSGKLEEAIRQKDEALALYHHSDLLVDFDDIEPVGLSDSGFAAGRKSLVKNSVALARKCRELQSQLQRQINDMVALREENELLSKKEASNQLLFQEITQQNSKHASAYIVSAVRERDSVVSQLTAKVNSLQMNLREIVQERDALSSKLTDVLERREQLGEMRNIIEDIRQSKMTQRVSAHTRHIDDEEDFENDADHIFHHKSRCFQESGD